LRILKSFLVYSAILGCVLVIGASAVHVLMAREYRLNVAERLTMIAHNGEEAVEENPPGRPIASALASALSAPDEGLVWLDANGRQVASSGMIETDNAAVAQISVHDGPLNGEIRATISNDRAARILRQLDLSFAAGTAIAIVAGGLVITAFSARSMARVESAYSRVHRFTGDAAHELRTPLAIITANADRLAHDPGDDRGRERALANIRQAANEMRELMDELLILARADGDVANDLHAIDVRDCVEKVTQGYYAEAAARKVHLTVRAPERQTIYGQPEQIARIIANLLENALRYTPANGSIDVVCAAERGVVAIEVRDNGVGIAAENLERIFDRFWRADGARADGGSGLGLAIARSLARAHGGDVSAKSRPGAGSTFTIRLPLRPQRFAGPSTFS